MCCMLAGFILIRANLWLNSPDKATSATYQISRSPDRSAANNVAPSFSLGAAGDVGAGRASLKAATGGAQSPSIDSSKQPLAKAPDRLRVGVITHTVQPTDTLQVIAATYGLKDSTVLWSNPTIEEMWGLFHVGQEVVILPFDGAYHTVREGETVDSIARTYGVSATAITGVPYNNLRGLDNAIGPGIKLIVAGGVKPREFKNVAGDARGTGTFQWPAAGTITQNWGGRHSGIDIAAYTGAPIYAADSGVVSFAGWSDIGYGNLIIIDHANGMTTYYAHLSKFSSSVGQAVARGQLIAAMGSTGNSSGPHLHFEIRSGGVPLNPRPYLPQKQ